MRVILRAEIFPGLLLSTIGQWIWLGMIGRHRILVEDETHNDYQQAKASWPCEIQGEWDEVLANGLRAERFESSYHHIIVTSRKESSWSRLVPELSVQEALEFLQRPYRLLLENGVNDREFLLCACEPRERKFLEERIEKEWLEAENCGGNQELKKRAERVGEDKFQIIRTAALFDSDDVEPGRPDPVSRGIEQALQRQDIYYHRLKKRAIENYLPRAALERWCKLKQGNERKKRERMVRAYFLLSDEERAYFHMKEGLSKDEASGRAPKRLFQRLQPQSRVKLNKGFGEDIQALYASGGVKPGEFEQDAAFRELRSFIQGLIERIR